jgi:deoxycytidine triphosphate deaminase
MTLITGQNLLTLVEGILSPSPDWQVNDNRTGVDFRPQYPNDFRVSRQTFENLRTNFTLFMPNDVYALIGTRSWAAQEGLDVCGSSAMVEPSFKGRLILEIASRRQTWGSLFLNKQTKHIATLRFFATEQRLLQVITPPERKPANAHRKS